MAANKVLMPQMGYDMTQGKIVRWIKKEGDQVEKGEPIAEIETEKVNIEIEAFASGTLLKITVPEGETVPVGQQIALIGQPGEEGEEAPADQAMPAQSVGAGEGAESQPQGVEVQGPGSNAPEEIRGKAQVPEPQPVAARSQAEGNGSEEERVKISPVARKLAQEQGIELSRVEGTGPGGRITKEDVERFMTEAAGRQAVPVRTEARPAREEKPQEAPAAAEERAPAQPAAQPSPAPTPAAQGMPGETRELSRMGQAIARRMTESKQNIPHFYATVEIDMAQAASLREELNRTLPEERKISFNDFILKAAALALVRYPMLNASYQDGKVTVYKNINVAQAVALEEGLIAPVIQNCDQKPLAQVARESKELVGRVKEGKLRQEDYEAGTFTVSNMGMLGVDEFSAIINPPQAAILALGAIAQRPVVKDGNLTVSRTMKATLSVDHRVANGADGARYLQEFQQLLEDPVRLLL